MRWKSKTLQNPHEPFKRVFVWRPRQCLGCTEILWLERMYVDAQVNEGGGTSEICYCQDCAPANVPNVPLSLRDD